MAAKDRYRLCVNGSMHRGVRLDGRRHAGLARLGPRGSAIAKPVFLSISMGGPMNGTGRCSARPLIIFMIEASSASVQVFPAWARTARTN